MTRPNHLSLVPETEPGDGSEQDRAARELFARLVPLIDPPEGDLLDEELVAALAEGRLLPAEEARVVAFIRSSPAARVELRDLYPEAYQRLIEPPAAPARPPRRWPRRVFLGVLATAAAAAAAVFLVPVGPPDGATLDLQVVRARRSAPPAGEGERLLPGDRAQLLVRLGRPSAFDALRGARPWGALYRVDDDGRAALVCTSEAGGCRVSDDTMAWLHTGATGARFVFVAGSRPLDAPEAIADAVNDAGGGWDRLLAVLVDRAGAGWTLHPSPHLAAVPQ